MDSYETTRLQYKPDRVRWLLIAESPPPPDHIGGSRHFYRADKIRQDDRLFLQTIRALYLETAETLIDDLEKDKEKWLRRLQQDGVYMIEALEVSQQHKVEKKERQRLINESAPRLIERVSELADPQTNIILIKSNVFEMAAGPLREAGFKVLNEKNVDYPGVFNQNAYRQKLGELVRANGWTD